MRRIFKIFFVVALGAVFAYGGSWQPPDSLQPGNFKHVDEDLVFGAQNLYGHIDGGAELFLEIGFDSLFVFHYRDGDEELALELYRMQSPLSALGIYLQKCGHEQPLEGIATRNTHNPYQTLLLRDRYYIQINTFSGKQGIQSTVRKLANSVIADLPKNENPEILSWLPKLNRVPGSERLVRGKYALEPIYTLGPGDILGLNDTYFALTADYESPQGRHWSELIVRYQTAGQAQAVFKGLVQNLDPYLIPLKVSDEMLTFKDYQNQYGTICIQETTLHIRFHLPNLP